MVRDDEPVWALVRPRGCAVRVEVVRSRSPSAVGRQARLFVKVVRLTPEELLCWDPFPYHCLGAPALLVAVVGRVHGSRRLRC